MPLPQDHSAATCFFCLVQADGGQQAFASCAPTRTERGERPPE
jgi:hypothetical protein